VGRATAAWTDKSLHAACRRTFTARYATCTVAEVGAGRVAEVEYEPGRVEIRLDPELVGKLVGAVHECIHVLMDEPLAAFSDEIQEGMIEKVLEVRVVEYIRADRRRLRWWRDALRRKARHA
jgi:hypothetical protein